MNHALAASGLPGHPDKAVRGFIGNGSRILIERAAPANAGKALIDQVEQSFKADYDLTWQNGTSIYPGISGLLESLQTRGYPLAVLSNKPHSFTVTIVERLFPTINFEIVLGQRPGIPHKPHPKGASEISRTLLIPTSDCIIIGDSTMDLETARNAGMKTIAVTWGFHDRDRLVAAGAGFIADDPSELLEIISSGSARPPAG